MVSRTHVAFKADDRSYFAILKKEIHAIAVSAGFTGRKLGEIDIIVAEMVSNLVKHAGGGQLLVKLVEEGGIQGIEIISLDNGPGMTDVTRMVGDGISTKNTLGHGLGAMKRLSNLFQVYSLKDWGTVILVRVFDEDLPLFKKPSKIEIKSAILPKPGENECGDGFYCTMSEDHIKLFLGDGLGHGKEAEKAIMTAGEAFLQCEEEDPKEILNNMNLMVKKTRGLVGTVAVIDLVQRKWRICGVGNIATRIIGNAGQKNYMAYNGIIGLNVPRTMNVQEIPYEKGDHLIMCSDGIKSRWDTSRYINITRYDLSILSAALIKDFARLTDDMSVAVCKLKI